MAARPAHQVRCDVRASEGMDRVEETIDLLRCVEDARAGTNVFGSVGRDAENDVMLCAETRDGVARLRAEHDVVLSVTPYRTEYVRAGPSILNTPEEVDRLLDAIHSL